MCNKTRFNGSQITSWFGVLWLSFCSLIAYANPMQPDHDQVLIKPAVTVIQEPRVPELSSILIIGERRTAMFNNGDEKKVGDTIAGHIVKRIEPSYVILERAGKEHILKLPTVGELVITPAKEE